MKYKRLLEISMQTSNEEKSVARELLSPLLPEILRLGWPPAQLPPHTRHIQRHLQDPLTRHLDPVFDPRKSSSFSSLPCSSPLCRHLDSPGCSSKSKTCLYQVSYGDGSFTFDDFSTETLTFRRLLHLPTAPSPGCSSVETGWWLKVGVLEIEDDDDSQGYIGHIMSMLQVSS
ncbi:hypothetical protein ACLB2K_030323 [Fragaria x ananassa]